MCKLLHRMVVAMALAGAGPVIAQAQAAPAATPAATSAATSAAELAGTVTVAAKVRLAPNIEAAAALVAVNDMRAMMKRQPGCLSETSG